MQIIREEWDKPATARPNNSFIRRHYILQRAVMDKLKVPLVDAPVSALVSSSVFSRDGEDTLRSPEDRRAEGALKKVHEASSTAIRAATTVSMVSRAALQWSKDLLEMLPHSDTRVRQTLNKIIKAWAFTADATLDTVQQCARAQSAAVAVRRQFWLKSWNVDSRSKQNLSYTPFLGTKLFGESLEPVLVEGKDKKKALPSIKKKDDKRHSRQRSSFRPFHPYYSSTNSSSQARESRSRGRWGDSKFSKNTKSSFSPKDGGGPKGPKKNQQA